jgi:hypothetical protein
MSTKIYTTQFVSGPAVPVAADPSPAGIDLLQARTAQRAARLLSIEFVVVSLFTCTVAAWVAGVSSNLMLVVLAIDGIVAAGLLGGSAIRKFTGKTSTVDATPAPHWARVAKNYHQLRAMGLPRSAPSIFAEGISEYLVLEAVEAEFLQAGDVVLVEEGQTIPADGKILEGMAVVDQSVVTGQSAFVVCDERELNHVMRASIVVSGQIFVEVAPRRGHPLDWIGGAAAEPKRLEVIPR